MKLDQSSEPCLIEIRLFGVHIKASGTVAVLVAGSLCIIYLGFSYLA